MGRVKIQIKRIIDRTQKNIAFAKRKNGLIKKAYELSVLCDVPIALVFFSPSGKLFLFESKTRIEETVKKFVDHPNRESLEDEQFIREWINTARLEPAESNLGNISLAKHHSLSSRFSDALTSMFRGSSSRGFSSRHNIEDEATEIFLQTQPEEIQNDIDEHSADEIDDEIDECNAELANVEKKLEYFLKNPHTWETSDELDHQEKILQETLDKVRSRKQYLEAETLMSHTGFTD